MEENSLYINTPRRVEGSVKGKEKGEYWCSKHGFYWQYVYDHNRGHGCRKCAISKINKNRDYNIGINTRREHRPDPPKWVLDSLVIESERQKVFSKKFSSHEKFHFVCEYGHVSYREISNVYKISTGEKKEGCKFCSTGGYRSIGELEVEDWCKNRGYKLGPRRGLLSLNRELDIFLPEQGVAIEYDGELWHQEGEYSRKEYLEKKKKLESEGYKISSKFLPKWKGYHKEKDDECYSLGIILIHIKDEEWKNNKDLCINRIEKAVKDSELLERKYENFYSLEEKNSEIPDWFKKEFNYNLSKVNRKKKFKYTCVIHGEMYKTYSRIVGRNGERIVKCRYCESSKTRKSKRKINVEIKDFIEEKAYNGLVNGEILSKDKIKVICSLCRKEHYNTVSNLLNLSSGKIKSLRCRSCSRKESIADFF